MSKIVGRIADDLKTEYRASCFKRQMLLDSFFNTYAFAFFTPVGFLKFLWQTDTNQIEVVSLVQEAIRAT